jgi:hypothetical protein
VAAVLVSRNELELLEAKLYFIKKLPDKIGAVAAVVGGWAVGSGRAGMAA